MSLMPYANEPFTDFTRAENADRMSLAVRTVRESWLGKDWPMFIDGQPVTTGTWIERHNPCNTSELVGRAAVGTREHAEAAINAATRAFESWRKVPANARARYLLRASAILKKRKYELCALEAIESGKTWAEADGDVAEAIDFLEFYARSMVEIDRAHPCTPVLGEENEVRWIPMGVGLVIPPWNFPLAILVGMTTSCMVAGNTVVLKPSPRSPVIAGVFLDIMRELQLPAGVLNLVQGEPEEIGDYMVDHPKVRLISFTGSKAVGCRIYERAAKVQPGQKWLKRVIAEMGGKDAMLIDDACNLDAAAASIVQAAFGFQGQKCSACSRVIAHEKIHDALLEKVVALTNKLVVGPADERASQVAAVVDERSYQNILNYIEIGKKEGGRVVTGGGPAKVEGRTGWYIQPTVIADVQPNHRIHCEEIFGPVVAFLKCRDFDHGLEIANSTEYALTGGVFSDRRENLEKAREDFHVGNLYLNRKCTGAMVDAQPFGGFNMSGTDDKAGGREHVYRYLQAKTTCERL